MRIDVHNYLGRFMPSGRAGNWSTFALIFALSAFALAARAQTVGPITPNPSKAPQAAPSAPPENVTPAPSGNAKGNLAGMWKLNRDQSDDPRQKLEQASSGGGGGWGQGPSSGGGWGGWGGWGGPGTGRGGGWNRTGRPIPEGHAVDMSDFSQLTIEQSDSSAKVTGATGRVLAQYSADNGSDKGAAKKSKDNPYAPPAAHWQGDQLVTAVSGPRGAKTTRVYELSYDGKQLYVTTRLEIPRFNQPANIRFVYDLARLSGN
jgi:hypothetical protein